jgi:MFS family permease
VCEYSTRWLGGEFRARKSLPYTAPCSELLPVLSVAPATEPDNTFSAKQRGSLLAVLFALNFMNFYDRQVIAAVGEQIKREWLLSDSQLAGLTTAFVLLYAVVSLPFGRLADAGKYRVLLTGGVAVWSACTALSGLASSFALHVLCRMGVGVGEASLAPAANALIANRFPVQHRARALSVFMLGLPLGLGASYLISGWIAQRLGGWRPALLVAAAPGVLLAIVAWWLPLGAAPRSVPGVARVSAVRSVQLILANATMRWIIVSGAVVNLALYAVSAFAASYSMRYHGLDIAVANRYNALVFGVGGGVGMVCGGWLSDRVGRAGPSGRLTLASVGAAVASPLFWLALQQPRGAAAAFAACLFAGVCAIYLYYSNVYAAIHDIMPAHVRGTAMSVYFFVFYIVTAIGLLVFGRLSDVLTQRALLAGATALDSRALGLHDAMYAIPIGAAILCAVLVIAARSALHDHGAVTRLGELSPVVSTRS